MAEGATNRATLDCEICEKYIDVIWYCSNCKGRLCDKCKIDHLTKSPIFRDHVVIPLSERQQQADKEECSKHPTYCYMFYCEDCCELVCLKCINENHDKHNLENLEVTMEKVRREITEYRNTLRDKILPVCHSEQENLNNSKVECRNYHSNLLAEIRQKKVEMKMEIDHICDELLQQTHDEKLKNMDILEKTKHVIHEKCEELQRYIMRKLKRGNPENNGERDATETDTEELDIKNFKLPSIPDLDLPKTLPGIEKLDELAQDIAKLN